MSNAGHGGAGGGLSLNNPYNKKDYEAENSRLKMQLYETQTWLQQTLQQLEQRNEVEDRLRRTIDLLKEALHIHDCETSSTISHESSQEFPGLIVTEACSDPAAYDASITGSDDSWESLRQWMGDDRIWSQMKEMHPEGHVTFHLILQNETA